MFTKTYVFIHNKTNNCILNIMEKYELFDNVQKIIRQCSPIIQKMFTK